MLLSEQIKALCKEHDLNAMTISYHVGSWGDNFTANAHWANSGGKCSSGSAETPEMAIAKAVAEANALRGRGVMEIEPITVEA